MIPLWSRVLALSLVVSGAVLFTCLEITINLFHRGVMLGSAFAEIQQSDGGVWPSLGGGSLLPVQSIQEHGGWYSGMVLPENIVGSECLIPCSRWFMWGS